MMKRIALAAACPLILLAGCGKGDVELKNASVEDVVKATANAQALNPGQWSTTAEVVSVDLPGMPAQAAAMKDQMAKALVGRQTVSENCVTPEQAKKPPADMLAGAGNDCRFDSYEMTGGSMNAKLVCTVPGGGTMKMSMAGPFSGNSFALDSTMEMSGPPAAGGKLMTVKTKMTGKRLGECTAPGANDKG